MEFIRNDCYAHALAALAGTKLTERQGNTLVIGPGTPGSAALTMTPDGAVHSEPAAMYIPLRTYPSHRGGPQHSPFVRAWHRTASDALAIIEERVRTVMKTTGHGHPALPDTPREKPDEESGKGRVDREAKRTAQGVTGKLYGAYLGSVNAAGYRELHRLIGKERVARALRIAGSKAFLVHLNSIQRNPAAFEEAHRQNPNAVVFWFHAKKHTLPRIDTEDITAAGLVAEAREHFLEQAGTQWAAWAWIPHTERPDPEALWEAFSSLHRTAVNQRPPIGNWYIMISRIAALAGGSPSCSAVRKLASRPSRYLKLPDSVLTAFLRESEIRKPPRRDRGTQAELMMQLEAAAAAREAQEKTGVWGDPLPWDARHGPGATWEQIASENPAEPGTRKKTTRNGRRGKQGGELPARPDREQLERIILGPALEELGALLSEAVTVEESQDRVALTVSGEREPALVLERGPDGSIRATGNGYFTGGMTLPGRNGENGPNCPASRGMGAGAARRTTHSLLSENWERLGAREADRPPTENTVGAALRGLVHQLPQEAREGCDDGEITRRLQGAAAALTDEETWKITGECAGRVEIPTYNRAVRAKGPIAELMRTNPGAAAWYLCAPDQSPDQDKNQDKEENREDVKHPGQVITLARAAMLANGMDPQSWRTAAAMPAATAREAALSGAEGAWAVNTAARAQAVPSQEVMRRAPEALRAIAGRQRPGTGLSADNAGRMLFLAFRESAKLALERPGPEAQRELAQDMDDVTDYVRHLGAMGREVSSKAWRGLRQASELWHRDQGAGNIHWQWRQMTAMNGGVYRSWKSLLGETQAGDLTLTPITDENGLYRESLAMQHCVISYGEECARGTSRIFSVERDGRKIATGEIVLHGGIWRERQTRGVRNHPAAPEAGQAIKHAAREYTKAHLEAGRHGGNGAPGETLSAAAEPARMLPPAQRGLNQDPRRRPEERLPF